DPSMTTPYQFYQFWINQSDEDSHRLLRVFTLLTKDQIEAIEEEHSQAPHLRLMQKALAKDVTIRVHSEKAYEIAVKASEVLYGKATLDTLRGIEDDEFEIIFDGVPQTSITRIDLEACTSVLDLVSTATQLEI